MGKQLRYKILLGCFFIAFCAPFLFGNASTSKTIKASFYQKLHTHLTKSIRLESSQQIQQSTNAKVMVMPCSLGSGVIGGNVFFDYNYNGIIDEDIFQGIGDIEVNIYGCDANGASQLIASTTTDTNGDYSFMGLTDGVDYRVEFIVPEGLSSTKFGADSQSSVRFVSSPTCDVRLGVSNSTDFHDGENPDLVIPCYVNGDPLAANSEIAGDHVLVRFNYDDSGNGEPTTVANADQIGSTYGIAWQRGERRIFASSFLKRHVGLGPLGLDGIYAIDMTDFDNPVVINWLDGSALGMGVGDFLSNSERNLPISRGFPSNDASTFDQVGKIGYGDIDIGADDETLWAVSLTDKTLYSIPINSDNDFNTPPTAAEIRAYPLPDAACENGEFRPFGLKVYRGEVYVGGVCDASMGTATDLESIIYKLKTDETYEEVLRFDMDYAKGYAYDGGNCEPLTGWFPWSDVFPVGCNSNIIVEPSPLLSDIEFDVNGAMIIGYTDRMSHQIGWLNFDLNSTPGELYSSFSGGEILRAGINSLGNYELENNANDGINTTAGQNNGDGPGGGEFYHDEVFNFMSGSFMSTPHSETSQGALAILPGTGEVVNSALDPFGTNLNSGGVNWFNNTTGAIRPEGGYIIYQSPLTGSDGSQGKAVGVGDIEILCRPAPIEIGNYVFIDANGDGIQDPCETAIEGLVVTLYDTLGAVMASTTTDENGQYYFASDQLGLSGDIQAYTTYLVSFGEGQFNTDTQRLFDTLEVTTPFVGMGPRPTQNDSNGTIAASPFETNGAIAGLPYIEIQLLAPGEFNHSYDIGFRPAEAMQQPSVSLGDFAFKDCNNNGIFDGTDSGLANVVVTLTGIDNNGAQVSLSQTTDALGMYLFENLETGTYTLNFAFPQGVSGLAYTTQNSGTDDTIDSDIDMMGNTAPIVLNTSNLTIDAGFRDTEPPMPVDFEPVLFLACTDTIPDLPFVDNCDPNPTVNVQFFPIQADSCEVRQQRCFTATDACGRFNSICQVIIQRDDIAPELVSAPTDTTVDCPDDVMADNQAIFADNCDTNLDVEMVEGLVTLDNCGYQVHRMWTATDNCGNVSTATQIITVEDISDPILQNNPPNLVSVECGADPVEAPIYTTACGAILPIIADTSRINGDCDNRYTLKITYTPDNECYDFEFDAIIIVNDTSAPVLVGTAPTDTTISCNDMQAEMTLTFTDNCNPNMQVTPSSTTNIIDDCTSEIIRTWTATDNCGNSTSLMQTITVIDTIPPTFTSSIPSDTTVECPFVPNPITPTATDACSTPIVTVDVQAEEDGLCPVKTIYTITYTATDDCGNARTATQIITVEDNHPPVLSDVPTDLAFDCGEESDIPLATTLTANDACQGIIPVTLVEQTINAQCEGTYMLIRTWTATDACGNTSSKSQTITVGDDEAPVIEGVPANTTAECTPPALPTVTATDNCSTFTLDLVETIVGNTCSDYTLVRTWTATDDCGNMNTASYQIEITTTSPSVPNVPADILFSCEETIPAAVEPTIVEACYNASIVNFEEATTGDICETTITRTWTVEDECGNDFDVVQTVTVVDTTAPVLTIVEPLLQGLVDGDSVYLECDAIVMFDTTAVTATDNCDANPTICFIEQLGEMGTCQDDGYLSLMHCGWKAIDQCGNADTIMLNIFIIDTTPPELFGVPADLEMACDDIPVPPLVTALDNCNNELPVEMMKIITGTTCDAMQIIRTWTATDHCGNSVTTSQTINIADNTAPVLVGVPANTNATCTNIPNAANVTATDDCDDNILPIFTEEIIGENCDAQQIIRTWTATDNCGNVTSASQTINIADNTAPVLVGVPANTNATCTNIPNAANVTATDDCDDNILPIFTEEIIGENCDAQQIIRTWTATDNCGNVTSASQIINIADNTAPVLVGVPANTNATCTNIPNAANVTATDDCDDNILPIFTEEIIGENCDAQQIIRTWTATDNCGNVTSASQIINIADNTAPVLVGVPANTNATCTNIPNAANVTATDDCDDNILPIFTEEIIGENCDAQQIIRTWTATDNCGNVTSASQIINIADNTAPVLVGVPANTNATCTNIPNAANVTATDDCDDNILPIFTEEIIGENCDAQQIIRTWTATDNCGNVTQGSQVITIIDDVAPIITLTNPALAGLMNGDTIYQACDDFSTLVLDDAIVTDNCDDAPALDYMDMVLDNNPCHLVLECTWKATDDCGNLATFTLIMVIEDITAPLITGAPVDVTVECDAIPTASDIVATDNCSAITTDVFDEVIGTDCLDLQIIRHFTATDACGNTTTATQLITVEDTSAPVLDGVPANTTTNCDDLVDVPTVTATDNCDDNLNVVFTQEISGNDCMNLSILRTWAATDACGNSVTATQTITISDLSAPVLSAMPADMTIECTDTPPTAPELTATDNCDDNVVVEYTETQNDLACGFEIVRTWTTTDNCGNTTTHTQTITVVDNISPDLSGIPANITLECDEIISTPTADDLMITDNCSDLMDVTVNENITPGDCPQEMTIVRIFTATDACGNSSTATQVITLIDTTSPVITFNNPDLNLLMHGDTITVECDELPSMNTNLTLTDNCDDNAVVTFYEDVDVAGDCQEDAYIAFMYCEWTATDACGNETVLGLFMKIVDETAPVINCPADITTNVANGETIPTVSDPSVSDNCTNNINLTFETMEVEGTEACNYTIVRQWIAEDECGNTSLCEQHIFVDNCDVPFECPEIPITEVIITGETCVGDDGTITVVLPNEDDYTYTLVPDIGMPNNVGNIVTDLPAGNYLFIITLIEYPECDIKLEITIEDECDNMSCEFVLFDPDTIYLLGGTTEVCLPIEPQGLSFYDILLNGNLYTPPVTACALDTLVFYSYAITVGQGNQGPYMVDSWTYPGGEFTGQINSMQELVATMNSLDPMGNWQLNPTTFSISGGLTDVITNYGSIEITHIDTGVSATIMTNITSASFGSVIEGMLPGCNLIVAVDEMGCVDTMKVIVATQLVDTDCSEALFLTDEVNFQVDNCEDKVSICLNVEQDDILAYSILDNNLTYQGNLIACDYDTTYSYAIGLLPGSGQAGPYFLEDWTLNGETYSMEFNTMEELVAQMNLWSPASNWTFTGFNIVGGVSTDMHNELMITQVSTGANVIIEPNVGTQATGLALEVGVGVHDLVLINNDMDCSDAVTITVTCTQVIEPNTDDLTPDNNIQLAMEEQMPIANADLLTIEEGHFVEIDVCANDVLNGTLTSHTITAQPASGTVSLHEGILLYVPAEGNCENVTMSYEICNSIGCDDTEVSIDYLCNKIVVFNGFSPNNDGHNDQFTLIGTEHYPNNTLQIFNRYGSKVYEVNQYQNDWKGTYNGADLPDGIYFYRFDNGEGNITMGYIALQR